MNHPRRDALDRHRRGLEALGAGRLDDAARLIAAAVRGAPHVAELHANLGYVLMALGRASEAEASCRRAVALRDDLASAHVNLGNALRAQGRLEAAAASYRRATELDPTLADAHNNLGVALAAVGDRHGARASYARALALRPDYAEAHTNLGAALWADGDAAAAVESYARALALRDDPDTHDNLGVALLALGDLDGALAAHDRALAQRPDHAGAHANRGNVLRLRGDLEEALASYRRALRLEPGRAEIHVNVGSLLLSDGQTDEAIASCLRALDLAPDLASVHAVLGNALADRGELPLAIAACERAVELEPGSAEVHANLIFLLDLDPRTTDDSARAERERWAARHAPSPRERRDGHASVLDPDRRLRVGYVSADFKRHSAVSAFGPVIWEHDPEAVEVVCYSGVAREDEVTARFRAAAASWRAIRGLSDERVARLVGDDGIDVLVDLSGYSAGNRLAVFALAPAPVQVSAWGHAVGTGLRTMDYFFADPIVLPADERASFTERVLDLPCLIPYAPPPGAPDVGRLPALARGHVTFGCFNRPAKVGPEVLDAWAAILRRLPSSRVLFKYTGLDHASNRERLAAELAARGVDPARLDVLGGSSQADHLAAYALVDLALDPFPHGGGVTALEGLWMGVPMITLRGRRIPGRMGASFLSLLDLPGLIAGSVDDYVERAVAAAGDLPGLARLRAELRPRLAASPIGDTRAYCRAVEAAYREMWRACCRRGIEVSA